ncbi:MAG: hypothetical protein PHT19_16235 [Methylococcus sp.]|nr:hypothetical protein [Methylococcus sp.]
MDQAALEYWRNIDLWSEEELCLLLRGRDPYEEHDETDENEANDVGWAVVKGIASEKLKSISTERDNPEPKRAGDHTIVERHVSPEDAIKWANQKRSLFPHFPFFSELEAPPEKPISNTERENLLAMVLGMAMHSYGYDPNASRNSCTGENRDSIHATLSQYGLNVSADTIQRRLKDAVSLFPDAKPPK